MGARSTRHTNKKLIVGDREKREEVKQKETRDLKKAAKRGKDDEARRPRPWSGYIIGNKGGERHGRMVFAGRRLQGTGVNGCMQEQEESIFESAGELRLLRESGGVSEETSRRIKPMKLVLL